MDCCTVHTSDVTVVAGTAAYSPAVAMFVRIVLLGSYQEWQQSTHVESCVLPLQEIVSSCSVRHGM